MKNKYQIDTAENKAFLQEMRDGLLNFGHKFPSPGGGSYYLGDDGTPWVERPRETWITSRMTHVYSIGSILGHEGNAGICECGCFHYYNEKGRAQGDAFCRRDRRVNGPCQVRQGFLFRIKRNPRRSCLQFSKLFAKIKSYQISDKFIQTMIVHCVSKTHQNFKVFQPQIFKLDENEIRRVVFMIAVTIIILGLLK